MGVLQAGSSPGMRLKAGDLVLDRATSVDTKPVKKRIDALRAMQRSYGKAHEVASKAVANLVAHERKLGELDDAQDTAVEAWVVARIAAGEPRNKPLASLGGPTPSQLTNGATLAEAKLVKKLAGKDLKHADARVRKTAAAAIAAADAVLEADGPRTTLVRARDAAIAARDGLAPSWEKAFAALKRGARAAEDEGASGLVKALFDAPSRPTRAKGTPPTEAE